MLPTQKALLDVLTRAAERLREAPLPGDVVLGLERLAAQVEQPCVVAVVGKAKAGKSTFLNALLGEDLAQVGTSETTATINYFRHGRPDPGRAKFLDDETFYRTLEADDCPVGAAEREALLGAQGRRPTRHTACTPHSGARCR